MWGETTQVPAADLTRQPPKRIIEAGQLHGALTREAVARHFESFSALLTEVLKHCPPEAAHVASAVHSALDGTIAASAEG
jgi:hypothetical protein